MANEAFSREELFIAGLGGMGVLMAGTVLAWVAFKQFNYVSWLPSYGVQPRGGLSECTVVFSNEEITSPILDQAQSVILMDGAQYKVMEPRVRPNGLMIVDTTGLKDEDRRSDIRVIAIPGMETAINSFHEAASTNLILLGAYIAVKKVVPADLIEEELQRRYGTRENILVRNLKAFQSGLELGQAAKG